MDSEGSNNNHIRSNKRRVWNHIEEDHLIGALKEKRDPNGALMHNKPFVLYEDWCIIFGKDRATIEYAEGPVDAVEAVHAEQNASDGVAMQTENTSLDDLNFSPSSQHGSTRSKDKMAIKKARGFNGIVRALTNFVDRFGTHCEKNDAKMEQMVKRLGYNHDLSDARMCVNE